MVFRIILVLCLVRFAAAQEAVSAMRETPLGIRQQRIERMAAELEQKFKQLTLALQAAEPRQAERLQSALNRAKELQIQKRMAEVRQALDRTELDAAAGEQQALVADIQSLIALLLATDDQAGAAGDELERLAEVTRTIERLLADQRKIQRESETLAASGAAAKEQSEKLAGEQDEVAAKTSELAEAMGPTGNMGQTGGESVSAAKTSMRAAATSLHQGSPANATGEQKDAIQNLLDALDEIKERQKELDAAREAEKIAEMAARFRAMLEEQRQITAQTAAIDAKRRAAEGQLTRVERNAVRVLGDRERRLEPPPAGSEATQPGLAAQAQQAFDELREAGTSLALPSVVAQLRDDLVAVGNRLADDLETGALVSLLQADIELTLETLAEVLESSARQAKSGERAAASGAGGKQNARLPASAELALLRAAQVQINRRTAALDEKSTTAESPSVEQAAAVKQLAARQAEIAEMTARLLDARP